MNKHFSKGALLVANVGKCNGADHGIVNNRYPEISGAMLVITWDILQIGLIAGCYCYIELFRLNAKDQVDYSLLIILSIKSYGIVHGRNVQKSNASSAFLFFYRHRFYGSNKK